MNSLVTKSIETSVTGQGMVSIDANVSSSALLAETTREGLFSLYFSSTAVQGEPWQGEGADFSWMTPVLEERRLGRYAVRFPAEDRERGERQLKENSDRVTLLARKYVTKDKFGDEDRARLAIATERVRKLVPAVSASDYEAIEGILTLVGRVADSDDDIRKTLRIK